MSSGLILEKKTSLQEYMLLVSNQNNLEINNQDAFGILGCSRYKNKQNDGERETY
jgi:hypothetical protein